MLALALLVVLCLPGVGVQAEEGAKGPTRPAYSPVLRQNEDWSVLAGQDRSGAEDPFDPIKYVPLSDDGSFWVSFGGQARTRVEIWDDFGFGGSNDDTFLATRLRMHADLHAGEHVRFFVEGKSALATERDLPGGNRGLDRDELDLQQAFGDLTLPLGDGLAVTVRGGRQMLLLGKQRLVSPLDWSNSMRAWDGVMAILTCKAWKIHGFWTQFVPVQRLNALVAEMGDEYEHTAIDRIGRDPGAEQVVHVNVDSLSTGSDPGMLRPVATVTVKVIDAVEGKRLFPVPRPAEGPRGLRLTVRSNYRRADNETRGDLVMVVQALAQMVGRDVAYLFYDHRPRQPGQLGQD